MNRNTKQERITELLRTLAPDSGRIESLFVRTPSMESMSGLESIGTDSVSDDRDVQKAIERIAKGKSLDDKQLNALEAIIIPGERPVVDINNGTFSKPEEPFAHFYKKKIRSKIEAAIPAIGRVELYGHPAPFGGTGFVVGDGIMMTNRHVANIFADGVGRRNLSFRSGLSAGIDLKREAITEDKNEPPNELEVMDILMIHPYWDMALLRVDGLKDIEPLTLATVDPAELVGKDIAVIGYPAFDPRNNQQLQKEIFRSRFNIKRMQPGKLQKRSAISSFGNVVNAVTHDSSTLGGNSGSAVIDVKTGEVVALHFAGIYLKENYAVPTQELARDRRIVESGLNFGGRTDTTSTPWDSSWAELESPEPPDSTSPQPGIIQTSAGTWTIPIEVTVKVGTQTHNAFVDAGGATEKTVEPFHEKNYDNRKGYDEDFLGIKIPLPTIKKKKVVSRYDRNKFVLHYHNFSLVMHRNRRLAIYTASNIDGRPHKREPEKGDGFSYTRKGLAGMNKNDREKWFTDPRIPALHQLPDVFYNKDRKSFDKGHLVKREDVCWGDSFEEVRRANGDTFHVTNCSPQVLDFNRSNRKGIWGKLENEILKQAKKLDERYTVYSGPIFQDDDPEFFGKDDVSKIKVQIPRKYWKVIVVEQNGELESYAFIMEQSLKNVKFTESAFEDFEELAFDEKWDEYRISIEDLEEEIDLLEFPEELFDSDTM